MKKVAALLIAIVLLMASCAQNPAQPAQNNVPDAAASGNEVQAENPAFAGLKFSFILPEEYENVQYRIIGDSIAEAVFTKDGAQYTFRMAEGGCDTTDAEIGYTSAQDGTDTQCCSFAGNIPINYIQGGTGLAEWQSGGFSYSLYTDTCDGEQMQFILLDIVDIVQKQTHPIQADLNCTRLWAVDIDGYTRTGASYIRTWEGDGCSVVYTVCPEVFVPVSYDMEKETYEGRDFYAEEHALCWDGADDNGDWIGGTTYSRRILWYDNGCAHSLSASADDESISLDMISAQTALAIQSDDTASLAELTLTGKLWQVELCSGALTVNIWVYAKPFGSVILREIVEGGLYHLCEEDGFEYYQMSDDRTAEDPNVKGLIWETDAGMVQLTGGIPYDRRNDYPSDVWNFINADFAKSITEQLSGTG